MFLLGLVAPLSFTPSIAGTTWKLSLSIGREEGTWMPSDWAASGARLAFPIEVNFDTAACDAAIRPVQEALMGDVVRKLSPVGPPPSFVSMTGKEQVAITPGGWSETELLGSATNGAPDQPGRYAVRFFLDLPEGCSRNDVHIAANERIFFTCGFWAADTFAKSVAEFAKAKEALEALEVAMDAAKAESQTGSNPIARALAMRKQVNLLDKRTLLYSKLRVAQDSAPDDEWGTIEGPDGLRVSKRGGLCVKRKGGPFGMRDEFHILGTFEMSPV